MNSSSNNAYFSLSRFHSFWFGLTLPFQSLILILRHPSLLYWSAFPIALTFSFYWIVISRLHTFAVQKIDTSLIQLGISSYPVLVQASHFLIGVLLFALGVWTFSIAASLIACPFNDFLAEEAEKYCHPRLTPVKATPLRVRLRLIKIDFGKSLFAVGIGLILLMLSWIPVLNVLTFAFSFLMISFQFISYPQTRRSQGYGAGLAFLARHLYACLGFGFILTLVFAIPFFSCFCLPLAVVGGTLLVARAPGDQKTLTLR